MWEFIKKHPILFGALLFFFLAAIGLGVGLTLTGVFAPFGLTLLGLVGAGALLFGVTFVPPALVLGVILGLKWPSESQPELPVGFPEKTDDLTRDPNEPEVGDFETPGTREKLRHSATSATSTDSTLGSSPSSRGSSPSSSLASPIATEEQAREVNLHISKTMIDRNLPGSGFFQPSSKGADFGLNAVPAGNKSYKLVFATPLEAVDPQDGLSNRMFSKTCDNSYDRFYDVSKESGKTNEMYCPEAIKNLINSLNNEWGEGTAKLVISTKVQNNKDYYTYEYGFEIAPEQVKRIFNDKALSVELQPAPSIPSSSSSPTTSTGSTSGSATISPLSPIGGGQPQPGFSASPLAPPRSSTATTAPPAPLTKEELEEVKAEVLKVGIGNNDQDDRIRNWTQKGTIKVSEDGGMSLEVMGVNQYIFKDQVEMGGVDLLTNQTAGIYTETRGEGEKRKNQPTETFIKNFNAKYSGAAEPTKNLVNVDGDLSTHSYKFGFKISADKVRDVWESLKLEKEAGAAATQTPTPASTPPQSPSM